MTLGRLMELYQAEQQGKQIMKRTWGRFVIMRETITPVKLAECELSKFVIDNQVDTFKPDYCYTFFIKDEEDKYGNKINKNDKGKVC